MVKIMKKVICFIILLSCVIGLSLYSASVMAMPQQDVSIKYRFASKEEGKELLLFNKEKVQFSQNDLDYRMQKKDATMEEYLTFAGDQVEEFTDEEKVLIEGLLPCRFH